MSFVFRLISNIRFYAGMICMIVLMVFATRTNVFSFRWVPSLAVSTTEKIINTTYLNQKKLSHEAVLITYAHIRIGNEGANKSVWWFPDLQGDAVSRAITMTQHLQRVRTTDILSLRSSDGADGIVSHLRYTQTSLWQAQPLLFPLQEMITTTQQRIDTCTASKSQADALYNAWLTNYDARQVTQATTQAQEASSCISTQTVQRNSAQWVLKNLQTEMTNTQNYLTLIQRNQSLLVEYGNLVPTEIPSQLVQLQRELQSL